EPLSDRAGSHEDHVAHGRSLCRPCMIETMKQRRIALQIFLLLITWLLLASAPEAATPEESARVEGEVVLYSSLNNEQIVTLVDAFKKKYPTIKPSFYRATREGVRQRPLTGARVGRFGVDVSPAAGFQVQLMRAPGLPQRFAPAEAAAYDDGFKDPDGHWINVHSLLNTMAYN